MIRSDLVWSAVFAREYDRHAGLIATAKMMLTPLMDEERARCAKYARARADDVVRAMESEGM